MNLRCLWRIPLTIIVFRVLKWNLEVHGTMTLKVFKKLVCLRFFLMKKLISSANIKTKKNFRASYLYIQTCSPLEGLKLLNSSCKWYLIIWKSRKVPNHLKLSGGGLVTPVCEEGGWVTIALSPVSGLFVIYPKWIKLDFLPFLVLQGYSAPPNPILKVWKLNVNSFSQKFQIEIPGFFKF